MWQKHAISLIGVFSDSQNSTNLRQVLNSKFPFQFEKKKLCQNTVQNSCLKTL